MTDDTPDTPDGARIAKVIARAGLASRRDAERMVEEGRVTVNGKTVDGPALNVGPTDRIAVDGRPLPQAEGARLWLYHKPSGLVTTERDEKDRETVFDALRDRLGRVMSVGRLDLTSEGLLLLTNDGDLKRRLELPETGWLRRYRVRVNGEPAEAALDRLRAGVTIDGENFAPMQVTLDRQMTSNAWLTVGLREGRNREVRRAAEAVGLIVSRLIRVSYGPFQLGKLASGEVEEVKPRVLQEQLGSLFDGDFADGRRDEALKAPRHAGDRLMDKGRGRPGAKPTKGPGGKSGPAPRADRAGERPDKPRTGKPPVTRNDGKAVGGRTDGPKGRGKPGERRDRDGDAPRGDRPWKGKPAQGGERRAEGSRDDRPAGGGAKPWEKRDRGDRPARPPRAEGEARPWKDRPRRDGDDRPARGAKPWEKRDGDGPRKPRAEGEARPWKDRPKREGDDRPARGVKPWEKRERGDAPRGDRPPRAEGEGPRRDGKPRFDKPKRDDRDGDAPRGRGPKRGEGPKRGDAPGAGRPRRDAEPEAPRQTKTERKAAMRADTSVSLRKGGQRGRGIAKPKPVGGKSYVKPTKPKG